MNTDKPAGEMPDVIKFLLGEGTLDGFTFGQFPDNGEKYKRRYWWRKALRDAWGIRADKPDAAAAREMLDTMPNLFGDITQKPQPELAKWYDRNFQAIKRILQREAGL